MSTKPGPEAITPQVGTAFVPIRLVPEEPEAVEVPFENLGDDVKAARQEADSLIAEFQGHFDTQRRDMEILARFKEEPKLARSKGFNNWEELVEHFFHRGRHWAYRQIEFLKFLQTWEQASGQRYTPSSRFEFKEGEARYYVRLFDHPEEFMRAMHEANELAAADGKRRTANHSHRTTKRQEEWLVTKEKEAKSKSGRNLTYPKFRAWYDGTQSRLLCKLELAENLPAEAKGKEAVLSYCRQHRKIPTLEALLGAVRGDEFIATCTELEKLAGELAEAAAEASVQAEIEDAECLREGMPPKSCNFPAQGFHCFHGFHHAANLPPFRHPPLSWEIQWGGASLSLLLGCPHSRRLPTHRIAPRRTPPSQHPAR